MLVACTLVGSLLAAPVPASGQVVSGKLTGVVTDARTGEPIAGALVYLESTGYGSVSAENGRYYVLNVPPGSHAVVAELIGYQTLRVENVLVVINATRTVDLQLTPRPIAVDEIGVRTEATPWVDVRRRGSTDLITDQQLQNLPVNTVEEALELKQGYFTVPDNENILAFNEKWRGITSVRVRGGRNGETSTLIDGIPVNNFVFGGPAFSLTKAAVGQVTFRKGGLPAQYGNALSGVVDIATKEPTTQLAGSFEYQTSKLAGALGSTPDELNDFDFLEGYLGGAIPETNDRLRFLLAGRKQSGATRVLEFDDDVFDPSDPPPDKPNTPNQWDVFAGWRAFGFDDEQQLYMKLQYLFTPNTKLSVSYIDQSRQYQRYDFGYLLTYDDPLDSPIIDTPVDTLAVQGLDEKDIVLGSLQAGRRLFVGAFSHVIDRTFLNVNAGVFKQERLNCNFFQGICLGDDFSDISFTGDQFAASGISVNQPTAGTDLYYGGDNITTYVLRADVQSQVSDHHNLRLGVNGNFHNLTFSELWNRGTGDVFEVRHQYAGKPWDAAVYLQDVIEYDFMSLDLGLRLDVDGAGGSYFANPLDPTNGTTARDVCENPTAFGPVVDPVTGETVTPDPNWSLLSCGEREIRDQAAIIAYADDLEESSRHTQVSPRVGLSFPVMAQSSVFLNFAMNTQSPLLNNLYQNTAIGTSGEGIPCGLPGVPTRDAIVNTQCGPLIFSDQYGLSFLGNRGLAIERAAVYELGFLTEVGDDYALSAVAFYNDQSGLTGLTLSDSVQDIGATYGSSKPLYYVLMQEDYQSVRGIELALHRRLSGYWGLELNYTYSQARTNAAAPEREYQSRVEEADPMMRREIRSGVDIPHQFNGVLQFMAGAESPHPIFKHSSLSVALQARSGIPYTPTSTFAGFGQAGQRERNSWTGPPYFSINLRASKGFALSGVVYSFYVLATNITDRKNCLQPLPTTGQCDVGAPDQSRRRQGNTTGEGTSSTYFDRPHLYGPRRTINFGLRVEF